MNKRVFLELKDNGKRESLIDFFLPLFSGIILVLNPQKAEIIITDNFEKLLFYPQKKYGLMIGSSTVLEEIPKEVVKIERGQVWESLHLLFG